MLKKQLKGPNQALPDRNLGFIIWFTVLIWENLHYNKELRIGYHLTNARANRRSDQMKLAQRSIKRSLKAVFKLIVPWGFLSPESKRCKYKYVCADKTLKPCGCKNDERAVHKCSSHCRLDAVLKTNSQSRLPQVESNVIKDTRGGNALKYLLRKRNRYSKQMDIFTRL